MSITEISIPTGTWSVDKAHSSVGFAVDYIAGTFQGSFADFDAQASDGAVRGSARVDSVQVKIPDLAAHLQGPDFFDAQRHPELTFESREIQRAGDRLQIEGEITIKGHTEPVHIEGVIGEPMQDPFGGERFGLRLEATVDRTLFGVSWNNALPNGKPALSNEVRLLADLQLTKQED
jgi:polyisoprenoid-binding protein YceI